MDLVGKAYGQGPLRKTAKWMAVDRDLISVLKYAKRRKISLKEWVSSLEGKKIFTLWDNRDLKPFFYYFFLNLPLFLFNKHFRKKKASLSFKRIAYIISQFPETHETFILREIIQAQKKGIEIALFSLKHCRDKIIHPTAKLLMKDTVYPDFNLSFLSASFYFFITRPLRCIKILWYLVSKNFSSLEYLWKSLYVFPISLYFAKRIKEKNIKHVHAHWITIPATSAIIISKLLDVEFSITAHAWDIYVHHPMLKEKVNTAKFIVTCTAYNKKYLSNLNGQREKSKIILNYHGLNTEKFRPAKTKSNGTFTILSIGRLCRHKGFDHLIEACKILKDKGLHFICNIAGEGRFRKKLEEQIESCGLGDHVKLLGIKTQEEIKELYRASDLFALACVVTRKGARDGIPNVILEAFSCGIAAVSTNISGLPEVIENGVTGLLVPEKDSVKFAQALEKLYHERDFLKEMGENARKFVKRKFDLDKNTQELIDIFEERAFNK